MKAFLVILCPKLEGFFFETHISPDDALSDGPNMVTLEELEAIVKKVREIGATL